MNGFSRLAALLIKLTKKNAKFEWSDKCEKSFGELKNRLVSAPVLIDHSSGHGGFIIYSNASKKWLGCVLMQIKR